MKAVYNPKAVIPHAALLHQTSVHCAIFPTAASRRSLGRISVPMWPVALSGRLPVEALVSHHLTNKLIGREPIPNRRNFQTTTMRQQLISSISNRFQLLSQSLGQVTHVLLTRSPLVHPKKRGLTVRLACVKHAASVRPEPGSNSPLKKQHPANPTHNRPNPPGTKKSTKNPITNKPPTHNQGPSIKGKNKKQTKNKVHSPKKQHPPKQHPTTNQAEHHPSRHCKKIGIDLKHAVEFSKFETKNRQLGKLYCIPAGYSNPAFLH